MQHWSIATIALVLACSTAEAASRFVSTNGADDGNTCVNAASPCRTIRHALEAVASGDEVFIARGEYAEANTLADTGSIRIVGGWEDGGSATGPTVITPGKDRAFTITASGTTSGTIELRDLTIQRARVRGQDPYPYVYDITTTGGGLTISAAGDSSLEVVLDGMSFENNRAPYGGGASITTEGNASVVVTIADSRFYRNRAGGSAGLLLRTMGGSLPAVTIRNTIFEGNRAKSGGGGLFLWATPSPTGFDVSITQSRFLRNGAGIASAALFDSRGANVHVQLENNTFLGNRAVEATIGASSGPGADGQFGHLDVASRNNTIAGNSAAWGPGGFHVTSGNYGYFPAECHLVSENDIVRGNGKLDAVARSYFGADVSILRRNGIHGLAESSDATITDVGVLDTRPVLESDGRLKAWSPAIDAVACDAAPAVDIDGDPRPAGARCDIGADEYLP